MLESSLIGTGGGVDRYLVRSTKTALFRNFDTQCLATQSNITKWWHSSDFSTHSLPDPCDILSVPPY